MNDDVQFTPKWFLCWDHEYFPHKGNSMYLCTSYQLFVINKSSAQNIKYLFEAAKRNYANWSRSASDVSGEMVMHIYFHGVYHHNGWTNLTHVMSYTICLYKSILQVARYIDRRCPAFLVRVYDAHRSATVAAVVAAIAAAATVALPVVAGRSSVFKLNEKKWRSREGRATSRIGLVRKAHARLSDKATTSIVS
ncbi:unnamed protein product [Trichogramma brassicae]|uniref:Uncharacterized protein n=1 Tax=Trichogramma brassicae TaxID=86971 RepID=A0A6H5HUJ8_9HYME|nr:unnamed protein product [Trichogramma brassicae]